MPRFPYVNYPFPFYRNQPRNSSNFYGFQNRYMNSAYKSNYEATTASPSNTCFSSHEIKNSSENENLRNLDKKNKSNKNTIDYLFDLFGLKIYSDDVLLVSILYFLYSEEVKDDGLFIVLILLLIS